jgi:hypothetical protein
MGGSGRMHPIQWRWHAEDLVRLRRSDEERRYAAPQRAGRVDPNPHQIEAVIFALSRLAEGGCILADEVGLGKTIEAGLVIAQRKAEGALRVLLLAPKALLGQWRQELYTLFAIEVKDGAADPGALDGAGVFLLGRELAGSDRGKDALLAAPPFDLIVIDEAHEIFGGLYKRVDASGDFREDGKGGRIAWNVFSYVQATQTPVLLLTATPIQNTLTELWALVRYVDPNGTLLGDLSTFRKVFCEDNDRKLAEGQEHELRRRIEVVLKRTLRRQAQDFLSKPFVGRTTRLFEYGMSPDEAKLYEDVTRYLLEPNLAGFRGNNRRLLLIAFHRRMASSSRALADSLEKVALRLRKILERSGVEIDDREILELASDFDTEDLADLVPPDETASEDEDQGRYAPDKVRAELERVERFIHRARALPTDSRAAALVDALRLVLARGTEGKGSGKMVVFTESLVTQAYLRELLLQSGAVTDGEVTIFRGTNDSPRAAEALERWWTEVGEKLPLHSRPSREMAMRLALVHEFKTRSKVFISTEAGAKGLNLQFSETVVNYDLPWNPQRIEQRIGRCHRYGQTRDVTVISFIAKDNETDRLLFEILSQKLDLFGTVLDSSDNIIYEPGGEPPEALASGLGAEVESSLRRIWERARTLDERIEELRHLRERMDEERRRFEDAHHRTAGLIESHFDEDVRQVFLRRKEELPRVLAELDADLLRVVRAYLDHSGARYELAGRVLRVEPSESLPEPLGPGLVVSIGAANGTEALHVAHPLVALAVSAARSQGRGARAIEVELGPEAPSEIRDRRDARGRLVLLRVRHRGLEPVDHLIPIVILEGEAGPLSKEASFAILFGEMRDRRAPFSGRTSVAGEIVDDAIEEALFELQTLLGASEDARFDRGLEQLERYVEDRMLLRRREKREIDARIEKERDRRDKALGTDDREAAERALVRLEGELERLEEEIDRLERRDDETYRRCKERLHERRYAPPVIERLVEAELVLT